MSLDQAQSIPLRISYRSDTDEEQTISLALAGDAAAIDWLITRYRAQAVRLARQMLRHSGEAEDAAQEAFIRAFQCLDSYRRDGKFYTWLYRIVVRTCLDRTRLSRWRSEVELDSAVETRCASGAAFEDADLKLTVEKLLRQLSPQMRAMVVLRELDGLEYAEIAEVLQIPIGRVKWRLNAARKQFQALWLAAQLERSDVPNQI